MFDQGFPPQLTPAVSLKLLGKPQKTPPNLAGRLGSFCILGGLVGAGPGLKVWGWGWAWGKRKWVRDC